MSDVTERSVPKVQFTDVEAGAKEFPDSNARGFNYFEPAKRKQTHYEDVTVEVQPDPRHYLSQGWIYGFANGEVGYPLTWTKLKAWGQDQPEPERGPGSGGLPKNFSWPAHGWHEFRDPNQEWEMTLYRYGANVVRQVNANIDVARQAKGFAQWNPNWVTFVERHVGAWMHIEHILGLYVFSHANRSGPTNMHNTAIVVNGMHKIRFAQDLALYNLTLSEEIEAFDGTAHLETWNSDPAWKGARKLVEALTAIEDDWGETMFAANVVFEPLVGEMFRSNLVQQAAAGNGDFVTPTIIGCGEYDYGQRDLRMTIAMFLSHGPATRSSPRTTRRSCRAGSRSGSRRPSKPCAGCTCCAPARLQAAEVRGRSRPGQEPLQRDRVRTSFADTRGACPVTTFKTAESPFKSDNTASNRCGFTLMNNQVGSLIARVMGTKDNVSVMPLPSMIRVDAVNRMDVVYSEIDDAAGEEEGWFNVAEFEENMSTHYGRMIHEDDRTIMFANPEDVAQLIDFDLKART